MRYFAHRNIDVPDGVPWDGHSSARGSSLQRFIERDLAMEPVIAY